MKIGIDISQIIYSTGVSTYTLNLVNKLLEIDHDNEYILFGGSLRNYPKLFKMAGKLIHGRLNSRFNGFLFPPFLADIVWNKLHTLNIEHFTGNLDVFHSSDWAQPPSNAFNITTIHDLVPIMYPKISDPRIVAVHKRRLERVKKDCQLLIVPTNTIMKDMEKLGFDIKKVKCIPEACDAEFVKSDPRRVKQVQIKYHIRGSYLMVMGTDPRKNISRILAAYMKIKTKIDLKLVVVGAYERVKDETRGVIYTGKISKKDVIALYSGAELLLYPSLYEGFGLPILEAFTIGTPVITSNLGSMKEVAGKGAYLVDPYNVDKISKAIEDVLKDRKKYIGLGSEEVKKFSWEKTAYETLRLYKSFKVK